LEELPQRFSGGSVCASYPEAAQLEQRRAVAKPWARLVDLAEEELALVEAAGGKAGHSEQEERVQIVGISGGKRLQDFDGVSIPALRDEDLAEIRPRLAVVWIVQQHEPQPPAALERGHRLGNAAQEAERVPVGDGICREQDDRRGHRASRQHPEEGE